MQLKTSCRISELYMPNNCLVGPALPISNIANQNKNYSLSSVIHASRFTDPPEGEYSLGNTLALTEGHEILPSTEEYSKLLADRIYDKGFTTTLITHIGYIVISPLFLIAFFVLLSRALYFSTNEKLSAQEEDIETARVFTDTLGYYLAPFALTLMAGTMGLINTLRDRVNKNKEFKRAKGIFTKITQPEFTNAHKYTTAFYLLIETIADLYDIEEVITPQTRYHYRDKLEQIEKSLKKILEKLELNHQQSYQKYVLDNNSTSTTIHLYDVDLKGVITRLQRFILNDNFKPIRKQLIESYKETAISLYFSRFFIIEDEKSSKPLYISFDQIENYCDRMEKDTYTQLFVFKLFGQRSRQKVDVSTSILIGKSNLAEESALAREMEVLNDFWNPPPDGIDGDDSPSKLSKVIFRIAKLMCICCQKSNDNQKNKKVIHPFKICLGTLMNIIHEVIFSHYRNIIINSLAPVPIKPEDLGYATHPAAIQSAEILASIGYQAQDAVCARGYTAKYPIPGPPVILPTSVKRPVTTKHRSLAATASESAAPGVFVHDLPRDDDSYGFGPDMV